LANLTPSDSWCPLKTAIHLLAFSGASRAAAR
jgi:hypothetical protein